MSIKSSILLSKRLFETALKRAQFPYKLNWVITKSCQSRCSNCQIWKVKPENELTLEEIELFNQKNLFFSWINFTGGEPTDRDDFPEIINLFYKYQKGLKLTHFPTNGLNPNRIINQVRHILKSGLEDLYVTVSIDGPEKINDRLRGVEGNFQSSIETLSRLRDIKKVKSFVGMTLYPYNMNSIDETFTAIKKEIPNFDYSMFHVNIPHVSSHFYENQGIKVRSKENLLKALKDYKEKRKGKISPFHFMEETYQNLALSYLQTGKTPMDCAALLASCFMNEKGIIYPCSFWNEPLGSLREYDYDLKKIFSQEKFFLLKEKISEKSCANCWSPCEAFQSILANPVQAFLKSKKS